MARRLAQTPAQRDRPQAVKKRRTFLKRIGLAGAAAAAVGAGFALGRRGGAARRGQSAIGKAIRFRGRTRARRRKSFQKQVADQIAFRKSLQARSSSLLANVASVFGF